MGRYIQPDATVEAAIASETLVKGDASSGDGRSRDFAVDRSASTHVSRITPVILAHTNLIDPAGRGSPMYKRWRNGTLWRVG